LAKPDSSETIFLPDFCGLRMVFVVVIITQLFAFVLALAPLEMPLQARWQHLGLVSLFVQWCTLTSSAVLCVLRPWLQRFTNTQVAVASYLIVLLIVLAMSEASYWFVLRRADPGSAELAFVVRNVVIAAILTGPILRYFYVQHQWRRNVRAEAQSRLQALQSRIRPHFLFNSMNTIASLTRTRPQQAEAAVEDLADLFRASLADARQFHALTEEWNLCRRYLEIEKLRLGGRLKVNWDVKSVPGDACVPPLLLQPLLENAIYHGIEPAAGGGSIDILGRCNGDELYLCIRNPRSDDAGLHSEGNRIAQDNIRERLAALYGKHGRLEIQEDRDTYCTEVYWPYHRDCNEDFDL
jgi:two-component system sensor histidine kinase AlgZ